MKDVEVLYTGDQLRERLTGMWQTDLFKQEAARPGSFIRKVIDQAAQYPTFLYDISDLPEGTQKDNEKLEWPHFYAWMGGVAKRTYANPAISDLALLHELYHKGHMTYSKDLTFEAFQRKMWDNELEASVTSELEIYFRHPEFRDLSFKQEILADRFLSDADFMKKWLTDPKRARDLVRERRRDAMHQDDPNDPVVHWIHNFADQNTQWSLTWKHRYNQVEGALVDMHAAIDSGADPKVAMDRYMAWLQSPAITQGTEVPFIHEARAFHAVSRLNSQYYEEALAAGELAMPHDERPVIDILGAIRSVHPDATIEDIRRSVESAQFMNAVFPLPKWSTLSHAQVRTDKTATIGSFILAYGYETGVKAALNREPLVAIIRRGNKGPNGEDRFGLLGGYVDLGGNETAGEQHEEGASRELFEEAKDDQAKAIISPEVDRLEPMFNKMDYKRPNLPVSAQGYKLELTASELSKLQEHSRRLSGDPDYRAKSIAATKGETRDVYLLPISKVLEMSKDSFTHQHEFEAVEALKRQLDKQRAERVRGS